MTQDNEDVTIQKARSLLEDFLHTHTPVSFKETEREQLLLALYKLHGAAQVLDDLEEIAAGGGDLDNLGLCELLDGYGRTKPLQVWHGEEDEEGDDE